MILGNSRAAVVARQVHCIYWLCSDVQCTYSVQCSTTLIVKNVLSFTLSGVGLQSSLLSPARAKGLRRGWGGGGGGVPWCISVGMYNTCMWTVAFI